MKANTDCNYSITMSLAAERDALRNSIVALLEHATRYPLLRLNCFVCVCVSFVPLRLWMHRTTELSYGMKILSLSLSLSLSLFVFFDLFFLFLLLVRSGVAKRCK